MTDERPAGKSRKQRSGKRRPPSGAGKRAPADSVPPKSGAAAFLGRFVQRRRPEAAAPPPAAPAEADATESLYLAGDYDYLIAVFEGLLGRGATVTPRQAWRYARACRETGRAERLLEHAAEAGAGAWSHKGFRTQYFQALLAHDRIAEARSFARESILLGAFDPDFLLRIICEHRLLDDEPLVLAVIDLALGLGPRRIEPAEAILIQNVLLGLGRPLDALRAASPARLEAVDADRHYLLANAAILAGSPRDALVAFNRALALSGLAPVALRDPDGPFGVVNLTASADLAPRNGPLVTVAMAVFNARDTIIPALESLSAQTYRDLEILVVDDGSTDDTAAVVARHAATADGRVRLVRMAENGGSYRERIRALAEARGTYFTCNDADDWSHPEKIARLVAALEKRGAAAVSSQLVRLNPRLGIKPKRTGYAHPDMSSTLYRREPVVERIGYYEPVRFGADSEYVARLALAFGAKAVASLDKVLLVADWAETTLTSNKSTGITDGGIFYPRRGLYRHAFRSRHARGEGLRLGPNGTPLELPPPDGAAMAALPAYQRRATRAGWSLDGATLTYRDPAAELFWKMPEGFAMPSNALLSLAESLLFEPFGRPVAIEADARAAAGAAGRVGLAYSGGIDSTAALKLLPDPVPIYTQVANPTGLHRLDNALLAVEEVGGLAIVSNADELPALFGAPRGHYGFGGFAVTAVLLADHLGLRTVADGNVVDTVYLYGPGGHGTLFNPQEASARLARFARAGLQYCLPCAGLSEVWTDRIAREVVHAMGCMRGEGGKPCDACMKCYRKRALRGTPIASSPAAEAALGREPIRMLGALLWARDHVGLSHPRLDGLDKDISWVDRWYPRAIEYVPEDLRDHFLARLAHYGIAPLRDATSLESWDARREPPVPRQPGDDATAGEAA